MLIILKRIFTNILFFLFFVITSREKFVIMICPSNILELAAFRLLYVDIGSIVAGFEKIFDISVIVKVPDKKPI